MFKPHLKILPPLQRKLWKELQGLPSSFVLYGGTAIALRLGHRQSVDFDFFSDVSFEPESILRSQPFLNKSQILQIRPNTLTISLSRRVPIKLSFFGGLNFGRVGTPDRCSDQGILIASLIDLLGHKLKTILQRIEAKDYQDIATILLRSGLTLDEGLRASMGLFQALFSPMECIKALTYFEGSDLHTLSQNEKRSLEKAVKTLPRLLLPLPRKSARLI